MVALIARAHLSPAASAAVDQLLRDNPIDPALNRFCKDRPNDLMADAATWADDIKSTEKTGQWHYVDIPLAVSDSSEDAMQWCAALGPLKDDKDRTGCILNATAYELRLLRDKDQSAAIRAKALRYVIHFLGDIAQPLHDTDNHDQGGNCTSITVSFLDKPANLHGIWDYALLANELQQKKLTQVQLAAAIDQEFAAREDSRGKLGLDLQAWAWEGHALAAGVVYGDLMPKIPVAAADAGLADRSACDAERAKVSGMHITIGQPYIDAAMPVIHQQIGRAGYRLADLLNQIFQ
jgi:hypothetical protein